MLKTKIAFLLISSENTLINLLKRYLNGRKEGESLMKMPIRCLKKIY